VVVFITERYIDKVGGKGDNGEMDNCRFEFNHIAGSKPPSRIITVVMEPRCRNQKAWYGMVKSTLHSQLYIDWASDDEGRAEAAAAEVVRMFRLQVPLAVNERMAAILPAGLGAPASVEAVDVREVGGQSREPVHGVAAPKTSSLNHTATSKGVQIELKDINQRQAEWLVCGILNEDVRARFGHPVTGAILASIDSAEDVQALFRSDYVLGSLRAKAVYNSLLTYRANGIDDAFIEKCKTTEGLHIFYIRFCWCTTKITVSRTRNIRC
jgi:hypothetical protein